MREGKGFLRVAGYYVSILVQSPQRGAISTGSVTVTFCLTHLTISANLHETAVRPEGQRLIAQLLQITERGNGHTDPSPEREAVSGN